MSKEGEQFAAFDKVIKNNAKLKEILARIKEGKADYRDLDELASIRGGAMGELLARDRKTLAQEAAKGLILDGLKHNHKGVAEACESVQDSLNQSAGIGIKALAPDFDEGKAEGLANRALGLEEGAGDRLLKDGTRQFSMATVDATAKKNARFWREIGISPKIKRIIRGKKVCNFCSELAGTYDYEEVKDSGNDVFRRHIHCQCQVLFIPTRGKAQDAHTKAWIAEAREKEESLWERLEGEEELNDKEKQFLLRQAIERGDITTRLHPQKQADHMEETRREGASYFTISIDELQTIVDESAGHGKVLIKKNNDHWQIKESIETEMVIGYDERSNTQTNRMVIHYSRKRTHAVPAQRRST